MEEMIGFEKFLFEEDATYLQQLLHRNGIAVAVEQPKKRFDAIVGHDRDTEYFIVKICLKDFDRANNEIEQDIKQKGIPGDYHFREMDVAGLTNVLQHPDEWTRLDVAVTKILLAEKGVSISAATIKQMATTREATLKEQRTISTPAFITLIAISIVGWVFPIIGGLMIYGLSVTNAVGEKVPYFAETARTKGLIIAFIGILSTVGWYVVLR